MELGACRRGCLKCAISVVVEAERSTLRMRRCEGRFRAWLAT